VRAAATRVGSSTVRDLLRLVDRPDVISLAGGLPDPSSMPVDDLADATRRVLAEGPGVLQYAPTEGDPALRAWILAARAADPDHDVLVTHGSQQALDLIVRAAVQPGDAVVVADPAYVGALQVLRLAGATIVGIPADEDGLDVGELADRLAAGLRPRLVYSVSTFHNPTGATLGEDRRDALAALAERYGFLVVEDDPYGELRWAGAEPTPMAGRTDRVVTLGSFSKIVSPGLRVGYAVGPAELISDLTIVKQAADLQTATFNQAVIRDVVDRPGWLDHHVRGLRATYHERSAALASALSRHLGDRARFAPPEGGMFLWVTLADPTIDTADLLATATDRGVAFVPGAAFAVDRDLRSSMRLSFATAAPDELADAARRLALALDEAVDRAAVVSR
jgi:2-aminoadipate transaminase